MDVIFFLLGLLDQGRIRKGRVVGYIKRERRVVVAVVVFKEGRRWGGGDERR